MLWFKKDKKQSSNDDCDKPVLLKTANSNYEFIIIKSVLQDNKIPYITQDYSGESYMKIRTGVVWGSIDFLVSKSDYEKAKYLVDSIFESADDMENDET